MFAEFPNRQVNVLFHRLSHSSYVNPIFYAMSVVVISSSVFKRIMFKKVGR